MARRAFSCALVAAAALAASPAGAAPPAPPAASDPLLARAAELKKAGDQAMEALRYADALAAYSDVHAITGEPALLYNMGRALQALNRYPEALARLQAFEAAASPALKQRVPRLPELIAELEAKVSTVTIHASAEGARVLVRSSVVGRSPLPGPIALQSGPAEIEIEADGYFPYRASVDLPGGGAITVEATLFSRATTGILSVRASAPGSDVRVDGKRAGAAPVEINIAGGAHTVSVSNPDFRPFETSAVVPAGGRKELVAELVPPSIATRWWFWTGLGAALAAGAAITAAELIERAPSVGTIAPGQLRTPATVRVGTVIRVAF